MVRIKITESAIKQVYELCKDVYDKTISATEAANLTSSQELMSKASAQHYFYIFKCMKGGEAYKRNMSAISLTYFIDSIYKEHGPLACSEALKASDGHIQYHRDAGRELKKFAATIITLKNRYSLA